MTAAAPYDLHGSLSLAGSQVFATRRASALSGSISKLPLGGTSIRRCQCSATTETQYPVKSFSAAARPVAAGPAPRPGPWARATAGTARATHNASAARQTLTRRPPLPLPPSTALDSRRYESPCFRSRPGSPPTMMRSPNLRVVRVHGILRPDNCVLETHSRVHTSVFRFIRDFEPHYEWGFRHTNSFTTPRPRHVFRARRPPLNVVVREEPPAPARKTRLATRTLSPLRVMTTSLRGFIDPSTNISVPGPVFLPNRGRVARRPLRLPVWRVDHA